MRYQLILQQLDLSGAPYWLPIIQDADSPEEAIDKVLASSTGELLNGAIWREVMIVPFEQVTTYQLERQPRPYFRRREAQ